MNRTIGISMVAVLVSVCGGIGLSLANTSSDSRWDSPLFAPPDLSAGYGEITLTTTPQGAPTISMRETKVAVVVDEVSPLPAIWDVPASQGDTWALQTPELAPVIALRPKSRNADKVAAIDPVVQVDAIAAPQTSATLQRRKPRAQTVSRSNATHLPPAASYRANPQPDFLIGVYR